MQLNTRRFLPALLTLLLAVPALAATTTPAVPATPAATDTTNAVEVRQFRLENARLPGAVTAHQTITAWQVTQGTWNGQTLDGLCIVLVHNVPEAGQTAEQTNCYVSHEATAAQREALIQAFFANQPQLATPHLNLRIEPAVISFEVDGQSVILHLGLIA